MQTSLEITAEIQRLESISCKDMPKKELDIHLQLIRDCYWRRRRAFERESGTPENEIPGQFASWE